jgi:hypothetical protein
MLWWRDVRYKDRISSTDLEYYSSVDISPTQTLLCILTAQIHDPGHAGRTSVYVKESRDLFLNVLVITNTYLMMRRRMYTCCLVHFH